jgi:iron-sulfur cluster repair protein YtfE (RIC family)
MTELSRYLRADHRYCDGLVDLIEPLAVNGKWDEARQALAAFLRAQEQHIEREERVLFPAMEQAHGAPLGPVRMMRAEHEDMRALLVRTAAAVSRRDPAELAAVMQTLRMVLQQHCLKEESVLYPMADVLLAGQDANLVQALESRRPIVAVP